MERTINVAGIPVRFRASAATVRQYRAEFNRDLLRDMNQVTEKAQAGQISGEELEILENYAYLCAKSATPDTVPADPDKWLEQFEMLDIYNIFPQLIDLWMSNNKTLEESKKKADQQSGN